MSLETKISLEYQYMDYKRSDYFTNKSAKLISI